MEITSFDDSNLKGNLEEYKDFSNSIIWHDMQGEFEIWISALRNELEFLDDLDEIRKTQGRISALREVLEFPSRVISTYEARKNENIFLETEL